MMDVIINLLNTFPIFHYIFVFIGTVTVLITILHPAARAITKATFWTKKDDEFLDKLEKNPIWKSLGAIGKVFKRFSLLKNT